MKAGYVLSVGYECVMLVSPGQDLVTVEFR